MATAAFLARWLTATRDAAFLLKVELTDPSTQTLYLTNRDAFAAPGSPPQVWEAALDDVGPVVHSGSLGTENPELATFDFHIAPKRLGYQVDGDNAVDSFGDFYWYGATVTLYQWEMGLTDFADAHQIFKGVVIDYQTENIGVRVYCQQRNSWIVRLPDVEVTRAKFPRAPDKSIGLPVPICYGDLRDYPARLPATDYGLFRQGITSIAGMRRAGVRGVVVTAGKGDTGQKGRLLFASHACALFNDDATGSTPAIESGDRLSEIDPIGANVVNAATGTGFDLPDITAAAVQPFDCFFPVFPMDSQVPAATPGENARAATDPWNDTSYATLDFTNNKKELKFPLPDIPAPGRALEIKLVVCYSTSAGATHLKALVSDGVNNSSIISLTASTTQTGLGGSLGAPGILPIPDDGWRFGTYGNYIRIVIDVGGGGETAKIYAAGVVVRYRPNWPIVSPASSYQVPKVGYYRTFRHHHHWQKPQQVMRTIEIPEMDRVDSTFYATLKGYADDGGGTYTGTASALIERLPDVLRHLLITYCGESSGDFLTTGSTSGSFTDARASLTTWRGSGMKVALALDEFRDSSEWLRDLCSSLFSWAFVSRLTDQWKLIPWRARSLTTDAPRKLTRWDLMDQSGPKVILHRDEVINDLSISFGFDAWRRAFVHETFAGPSRSSSGHAYRSLRDESVTVVASESDRIDFTDSGGTHVASLTPAAYAPAAFADHVTSQMMAVAGGGVSIFCGWAFTVTTYVSFTFNDGAAKTATLNAGTYNRTTFAAEIKRAMDAVSTGTYTVTYSLTTGKFTIARGAGTFSISAAVSLEFRHLAGFDPTSHGAAAASWTSDFAVYDEQFMITSSSNITLPWETGANGIDAATPRTAGMLLGFDTARDSSATQKYWTGDSPKNDREADCATSQARYGKRPLQKFELRAVNDTDTAREVRNRHLDWWKQPPAEIQFQTERAVDFDLGMVMEFDASLDEVQPFPVPGTDGSWSGKQFIVTSIVQHSLPTVHQEVVAFFVPTA
jgi:hypothetical protein